MSRTKKINILICALLLIALPFSVFAVNEMRTEDKVSGSFERKTVDRMNISITNTNFTLKSDPSNSYTVKFILKAEKTEPDFYAIINKLDIEGCEYTDIVFTPLNENSDGETLNETVLPAKDGKIAPIEYEVTMTFTSTEKSISPEIILTYTSGYSMLTSDMHLLKIPLNIKIK